MKNVNPLMTAGINARFFQLQLKKFKENDLLFFKNFDRFVREHEGDGILKVVPNEYGNNEFFSLIYESDPIIVPDMQTVEWYVQKNFGDDSLKREPSTTFIAGTRKKIRIFSIRKPVKGQVCVNFIENQKGSLPNCEGLIIAEITIGSLLPKDQHLFGFDYFENLEPQVKTTTYFSPAGCFPWISINSEAAGTSYGSRCPGFDLSVNDCFLLFYDCE